MDSIDDLLSKIDDDNNVEKPDIREKDEIDSIIDEINAEEDRETRAAPESPADDEGEVQEEDEPPAETGKVPADDERNDLEDERAAPDHEGKKNDDSIIDSPGTRSWNTVEPYVVEVKSDDLERDLEDLKRSFYFIKETTDPEIIKKEVKRNLLKHMRKPSENILSEYGEYIFINISVIIDRIINNMKVPKDFENIFAYHLGAFTVYTLLATIFKEGKYGFCYKFAEENQAVRYTPFEFIKDRTNSWFQKNVYVHEINFDSLHDLETAKELVNKKYQVAVHNFNLKIKELNNRVGPDKHVDPKKLIRLKGRDWFGLENILVFRRFIGRTIFD